MDYIPLIALGASALALVYALILVFITLGYDKGSEKMQKIALSIQEGANAYLSRQSLTIAIVAIIIFFALAFGFPTNGLLLAAGFIVGAFFSGLAGYIGMSISVRANVRTSQAAHKSLGHALKVAFQGGSV